ncbi:erythroferrone [Gastrophryne carolinensis]
MDAEGKPIPLRCLLMTISMGVLLVLLCAGPACTHKNREPSFQLEVEIYNFSVLATLSGVKEASVTIVPLSGTPVLTPPHKTDPSSEDTKVSGTQSSPWTPRYSWLMFLKHSDRGAKHKKKGHEVTNRHRHSGPVGPPAPSKHHNQPVNHVSREKKLYQFLQMLTKRSIHFRIHSVQHSGFTTDTLLSKKDGENTLNNKRNTASLPPKVNFAFLCKTSSDVHVEPGNLKELQLYEMPQLEGSFYRGSGLNVTSGRYTAPYTGLYAFFVRLHVDVQKHTSIKIHQGHLHVQLCILSLCQENLSLQEIFSLPANEVTATVTLNGILHVQAGQYVSIFLENKMDSWFVLLKGSDFSGVLLGQ